MGAIDQLRKRSEALFFSGELQPRTLDEVSTFVRRVGVHPNASVIDTQWKKVQRRLTGGAGSGATVSTIVPFSEVFAIVAACHNDAAKVDPSVAEDQDYFQEAWASCGGVSASDLGQSVSAPTAATTAMGGSVSTNALAQVLNEVGLSNDVIAAQRKQAAVLMASRSTRAQAPVDPESLTYKDFIEIVSSNQHSSAGGPNEADDDGGSTETYRPRLSLSMLMRIRRVVRGFRRRREERLERERRERELDEYARKYFGTDAFAPEGTSPTAAGGGGHSPPVRQPAASNDQLARANTMTSELIRTESQRRDKPSDKAANPNSSSQASRRPPAGGALAAARARRGTSGLPPLIDERASAFDAALTRQEAAERRHLRQQRQERLKTLQKSHPRSDGCIDVVTRYVAAPIESPLKRRLEERATSPDHGTHGTMGPRPRPKALSPTLLRQKATPTPARRAASRASSKGRF